jgi:chemotaxis response regulator CheB
MSILIVSANSLFKEVINEIITRVQSETLELNYEEALTRTRELRPDVIIIDETIPPPYFEDLLAEARNLEKTRIIVLNPIKNEIILLDSRRSTLRDVDDLMEAISSTDFELNPTTQI